MSEMDKLSPMAKEHLDLVIQYAKKARCRFSHDINDGEVYAQRREGKVYWGFISVKDGTHLYEVVS